MAWASPIDAWNYGATLSTRRQCHHPSRRVPLTEPRQLIANPDEEQSIPTVSCTNASPTGMAGDPVHSGGTDGRQRQHGEVAKVEPATAAFPVAASAYASVPHRCGARRDDPLGRRWRRIRPRESQQIIERTFRVRRTCRHRAQGALGSSPAAAVAFRKCGVLDFRKYFVRLCPHSTCRCLRDRSSH